MKLLDYINRSNTFYIFVLTFKPISWTSILCDPFNYNMTGEKPWETNKNHCQTNANFLRRILVTFNKTIFEQFVHVHHEFSIFYHLDRAVFIQFVCACYLKTLKKTLVQFLLQNRIENNIFSLI